MNPINLISQANKAFRNHDYKIAVELYQQYAQQSPEHQQRIAINLKLAEARLNGYKKHAEQYNKTVHSENDKIIVYTVNIGGYESVKEPIVIDPTVEYILFTDNKDLKSKYWKVIQLTDKFDDPRRTSRLPKILAHQYLPEHDISVYIDSSLEIKTPDVGQMVAECMEGEDIALFKHYKRDCVYDEIEFVMNSIDRVVANKELCKQALKKYEAINYPKNNGLFENAFIFRRNIPQIQKLNEFWWQEYKAGTERDQFVLMYALNQLGIKPNPIKIGKEFRKNPYVNFNQHSYQPGLKLRNISLSKLSDVDIFEDERFKKIASIIKRNDIKVVSFDIFDTLIIRKVLDPKDVFQLMAKEPFVKKVFGFYDFADSRVIVESEVRKSITDKVGGKDPSLDDIYRALKKKYKLKSDVVTRLIKLELTTERSVIEAHPAVKRLYNFALEQNKELIIISDMYLPFDFLESVLNEQGFKRYKKFYLSAEVGKTKKHGDIFPYISEDLGVRPDQILHLGDNLKSDIKMAENNGLKAMRIFDVRKRLLESTSTSLRHCLPEFKGLGQVQFLATRLNYGLVSRKVITKTVGGSVVINTPSELGYSILGPFLLSLILRIRRKSKEQRVESFLWLARDGYLPYKANKLIDKVLGSSFESLYLPISRKMLFPIYLEDETGLDQLFKISYQNDFLVSNFVKERFGDIGVEILSEALGNKFDLIMNQYIFEHHDLINKIFDDNFERIRGNFHHLAEKLDVYYSDILRENHKYGLFDVGRKGTFQKLLSRRYGADISGFYVVNASEIARNVDYKFDNFLPIIDGVANAYNPDTIIYELLLSDLNGSFLGVSGNEFIRAKKKINHVEEQFITEIQESALNFIKDSLTQFGEKVTFMEQQPFYAAFGMENAFKNESIKKLFESIPHYDEMSTNKPRMLSEVFEKPVVPSKYITFPKKIDRKRIVIYSPAITRIRGGAERVASRLANYLDDSDYDVLLVSSANPEASTKTVYDVNSTIYVRNINVNNPEKTAELVKSFDADCALVLASGSVLLNVSKGLMLAEIPFMLSERAEPKASLEIYWKGYSYDDYNSVYGLADTISVQFDAFKTFYTKANQKKTVTLANPFNLPTIDHKKKRRKVIVCAARIWFVQKRQDVLLKAFAKISKNYPDWRLEFYGNAYGDDENILSQMAKALNINDQVSISSSVDNIHDIFADSSIFVLPSKFEGFPNSLAEALSYGVPSIGFVSCPGVNQLIKDGVNGYLVPDENLDEMVNSLSEKLSNLIVNDDMRSKFSHGAIESMSDYSDEKVLSRWQDVIENLMLKVKRSS